MEITKDEIRIKIPSEARAAIHALEKRGDTFAVNALTSTESPAEFIEEAFSAILNYRADEPEYVALYAAVQAVARAVGEHTARALIGAGPGVRNELGATAIL